MKRIQVPCLFRTKKSMMNELIEMYDMLLELELENLSLVLKIRDLKKEK